MSKLQAPLRSEFSSPDTEMVPPTTAGNPFVFINTSRSLETTGAADFDAIAR